LRGAGESEDEINAAIDSIEDEIRPIGLQDAFVTIMLGEAKSQDDIDAGIAAIRQRATPIKTVMNEWLEANGYDPLPDAGDGYVVNWRDARVKAIAPGALATINTWLTNNGHDAMDSSNSVLDLVHVFLPDYNLGADNVYDAAA